MDKFEQSEQEGRILFKSVLESLNIIESQATIDKYDSLDYFYKNKSGQKVGVEIKKRSEITSVP